MENPNQYKAKMLLFNPYHDRLGRFAVRVGGAAVKGSVDELNRKLVEDKGFVAASVAVGIGLFGGEVRYGPRARKNVKESFDRAESRVPDEYKHPRAKVVGHKSTTGYVLAGAPITTNPANAIQLAMSLGYVITGQRRANISPACMRWASIDAKTKDQKDRKRMAETAVAHELIHTRKRSRGPWRQMLGGGVHMEEGMTELLLEAKTGYPSGAAYRTYSDSMARIAMKVNPRNRAGAINWIDSMHKMRASPQEVAAVLSKRYRVNFSGADVVRYTKGQASDLDFYLGPRQGASASLTGSYVKYGDRKRPNYDFNMFRAATGAVEAVGASLFLAGVGDIAWKGITAGVREAVKPTPHLDDPLSSLSSSDRQAVENDPFILIAQHVPLDKVAEIINYMKAKAADNGLDPLDIEMAFLQAFEFVANNSRNDEITSELDEQVPEK